MSYWLAYQTADGKVIDERAWDPLHPQGHPLVGEVVEVAGGRWTVVDYVLFSTTRKGIVVVEPGLDEPAES